MSKVHLNPDETILKRDSNVIYERDGFFNSGSNSELVLTNQALVVLCKNTFGKVKDTLRFPLGHIKVVNGAPQAIPGTSSSGQRQLQVYFSHGIEAFTLGGSDDDDDAARESFSLKKLFASQGDRERQNIADWCDSIARAALGMPQSSSPAACMTSAYAPQGGSPMACAPQQPRRPQSAVQGFVGSFMGAMGIASTSQASQLGYTPLPAPMAPASQQSYVPMPAPAAPINATRRCIGCMAPLSGTQGQKTTCRYCDTEQVI